MDRDEAFLSRLSDRPGLGDQDRWDALHAWRDITFLSRKAGSRSPSRVVTGRT